MPAPPSGAERRPLSSATTRRPAASTTASRPAGAADGADAAGRPGGDADGDDVAAGTWSVGVGWSGPGGGVTSPRPDTNARNTIDTISSTMIPATAARRARPGGRGTSGPGSSKVSGPSMLRSPYGTHGCAAAARH